MSVLDDNPDLSATSPADDSDALLSPVVEPEPIPGLNGVPVRCECNYVPKVKHHLIEQRYAKGTMYVAL